MDIESRLAAIEARVTAIDSRSERIEQKLDNAISSLHGKVERTELWIVLGGIMGLVGLTTAFIV